MAVRQAFARYNTGFYKFPMSPLASSLALPESSGSMNCVLKLEPGSCTFISLAMYGTLYIAIICQTQIFYQSCPSFKSVSVLNFVSTQRINLYSRVISCIAKFSFCVKFCLPKIFVSKFRSPGDSFKINNIRFFYQKDGVCF